MRRVDDHKHLGREIRAPAVKENSGHIDMSDLIGMALAKKMQACQPVLSVNDEIPACGLAQMADPVGFPHSLETQGFIGEQQDRSRYHGLRNDRFIEIDDLFDLETIERPLNPFFAALDAGDEFRDLVVIRGDKTIQAWIAAASIPVAAIIPPGR
jgi:hypothetical protein